MLDRGRDRTDEAVGNQDTEEGADQRRADLAADGAGVGPIDRGRGVHDPQHRRDDAEPGQCIGHALHRVRRLLRLLVMSLQLVLEQAFELMRIEVAAHDQPQAVGNELDHVMIRENARIVGEHLAVSRVLDVRLDGEHAGLADLHQDVVEQLEQIDVVLALVARALDQPHGGRERPLDHLDRIAGDKGSERGADNDDEFARVPQQQQAATFHHKAAANAQQNVDRADERKHARCNYR
jgi:hypothetical protein